MTNEEKVTIFKAKFNNYISTLNTVAQWKTFLNNITKAKVITGLKNAIQKEIDTRNQYVTDRQAEMDELVVFKNQLGNLLE